jgi:hypothetical protein
MPSPTETYRFNEKADAQLQNIYQGATTVAEKIKILNDILGGESNFYAFGEGSISEEMKLGCLEYEYLGNLGLIELQLA